MVTLTTLMRPPASRIRLIAVVLAAVALLAGLLATHSMSGSHDTASMSGSSVGMSHTVTLDEGIASLGAMVASVSHGIGAPAQCAATCEMHCGIMAAACLFVFVIAAVALVAAFPALYYRLIDQGRDVLAPLAPEGPATHRLSLTALSISRT